MHQNREENRQFIQCVNEGRTKRNAVAECCVDTTKLPQGQFDTVEMKAAL